MLGALYTRHFDRVPLCRVTSRITSRVASSVTSRVTSSVVSRVTSSIVSRAVEEGEGVRLEERVARVRLMFAVWGVGLGVFWVEGWGFGVVVWRCVGVGVEGLGWRCCVCVCV